MGEIIYSEKPEEVTFQEIRDILQKAHQENFKRGIVMKTPNLSAEELKKKIGAEGKCFVAMTNGKVIATASYRKKKVNGWFFNGDAAELMMAGVDPEFQGQHIFSKLDAVRMQAIRDAGIEHIVFDTAEDNKKRQEIAIKDGFKYVSFFAPSTNHYSVLMMKWLNGCPYSDFYCKLRFNIRKLKIKILYKPGHIRRFRL